jgi:hypothetical protein
MNHRDEAASWEGTNVNTTEVTPQTLDTIIAYQFTIAWAGEALSQPARLKWWRTDIVDEAAGGDLLQRLAPRTHLWASLEVVREAAILTDRKARQRMADPDKVRTLFFWGFEVDELLVERIRAHKWSQKKPAEVLPLAISLAADFDRAALEQVIKDADPDASYTVQTSGRELKAALPEDPATAARMLIGAMLPFSAEYPAPFFRI